MIFFYSFFSFKKKGYSLFVEFNDGYGLKEGTSVNYRGIKIGVVTRVSVNASKVVTLLKIKSHKILIPINSIFEANQIGIFNDIVVSITPPKIYTLENSIDDKSIKFLTPNSYIKGYKGISYDDLIRSTTRISQRFDDPRFFSLFYVFLKNSIYLSDEVLIFTHNFANILYILIECISLNFSTHLS